MDIAVTDGKLCIKMDAFGGIETNLVESYHDYAHFAFPKNGPSFWVLTDGMADELGLKIRPPGVYCGGRREDE